MRPLPPAALAVTIFLVLAAAVPGADATFLTPDGRSVTLRQTLGGTATLLLLVGGWDGRTSAMLSTWSEQASHMRGRIHPLVLVVGSSRAAANAAMASFTPPPRWLMDDSGWATTTLKPPTLPCLLLLDADGGPLVITTCLQDDLLRQAVHNPARLLREARRRRTVGIPDAVPPNLGPWGAP